MRPGRSVSGRIASLVHGRTVYLLASLLILIALGPWLTERAIGRGLWELLFTLVALSSIHAVGVERGQALISTLLALPTLASLWLRQALPGVHLSQVALALLTLFLLYTTVTVILRVFAEETVTTDTLSAALCVYLLMGYMWGSLYGLIYLQTPIALHLPRGWTPARENGIATDVPLNLMTYFSFTTLTGLGCADVLPISGLARAAVVLEAVFGQFYVAVLIARLVGLHIAGARR